MIEQADKQAVVPAHVRVGRVPVPREHGAWVILYAPALLGFAVGHRLAVVPAALLLIAITAAFLGREAAGLLLRGRATSGALWSLACCAATLAVAGGTLVLGYGRDDLLWIGALAAALFAVHSVLLLWPSRRRLDRSQWGELLGVGALALTAPASLAAGAGGLSPLAWRLWLACTLYFGGGIFFVKMLLAAVKVKRDLTAADRWRVGRDNALYHALLLPAIGLLAAGGSALAAALTVLAFAPAVWRALRGTARLSSKPPPLKRVGYAETVYSVWFIGWYLAAVLCR